MLTYFFKWSEKYFNALGVWHSSLNLQRKNAEGRELPFAMLVNMHPELTTGSSLNTVFMLPVNCL